MYFCGRICGTDPDRSGRGLTVVMVQVLKEAGHPAQKKIIFVFWHFSGHFSVLSASVTEPLVLCLKG